MLNIGKHKQMQSSDIIYIDNTPVIKVVKMLENTALEHFEYHPIFYDKDSTNKSSRYIYIEYMLIALFKNEHVKIRKLNDYIVITQYGIPVARWKYIIENDSMKVLRYNWIPDDSFMICGLKNNNDNKFECIEYYRKVFEYKYERYVAKTINSLELF